MSMQGIGLYERVALEICLELGAGISMPITRRALLTSGLFAGFVPSSRAMRYGVSVGKSSKAWSGEAVIKGMAKWPWP
jgi:hypothetical protein